MGRWMVPLEKSLIQSAMRLFKKRKWTFQQDNDTKHTADLTREWFYKRKINVVDCQADPRTLIQSRMFGER